jgi:hypothetical protein
VPAVLLEQQGWPRQRQPCPQAHST